MFVQYITAKVDKCKITEKYRQEFCYDQLRRVRTLNKLMTIHFVSSMKHSIQNANKQMAKASDDL